MPLYQNGFRTIRRAIFYKGDLVRYLLCGMILTALLTVWTKPSENTFQQTRLHPKDLSRAQISPEAQANVRGLPFGQKPVLTNNQDDEDEDEKAAQDYDNQEGEDLGDYNEREDYDEKEYEYENRKEAKVNSAKEDPDFDNLADYGNHDEYNDIPDTEDDDDDVDEVENNKLKTKKKVERNYMEDDPEFGDYHDKKEFSHGGKLSSKDNEGDIDVNVDDYQDDGKGNLDMSRPKAKQEKQVLKSPNDSQDPDEEDSPNQAPYHQNEKHNIGQPGERKAPTNQEHDQKDEESLLKSGTANRRSQDQDESVRKPVKFPPNQKQSQEEHFNEGGHPLPNEKERDEEEKLKETKMRPNDLDHEEQPKSNEETLEQPHSRQDALKKGKSKEDLKANLAPSREIDLGAPENQPKNDSNLMETEIQEQHFEEELPKPKVKTEEELPKPKVKTEEELPKPKVKTEEELPKPKVKTEEELPKPKVKTEKELPKPKDKTEELVSKPKVKTEEELPKPKVTTEEELPKLKVKTEEKDIEAPKDEIADTRDEQKQRKNPEATFDEDKIVLPELKQTNENDFDNLIDSAENNLEQAQPRRNIQERDLEKHLVKEKADKVMEKGRHRKDLEEQIDRPAEALDPKEKDDKDDFKEEEVFIDLEKAIDQKDTLR